MSCHNIGEGMNSVVKTIMVLVDKKEISIKSARILVKACMEGVFYCDGNKYEATEYISNCCCGKCLKRLPKGAKLYDLYNGVRDLEVIHRIYKNEFFFTERLCTSCFDKIVNKYYGRDDAGKEAREYIENKYDEEDYTSSGMYMIKEKISFYDF